MSPLSKVRQSQTPWTHKATQRAAQNRYWRKQRARVKHERDRTTTALKETQARLRQLETQSQGLAVQPKVELVFLALELFLVARIGCRAGCRVLSLLALALGIHKAPCPQTIINWVTRLSSVRLQSARLLKGAALRQAPFATGLIWMLAVSIALGAGKIVAVRALDAHHPHRIQAAPSLAPVRCLAVSVAASWTGESIADVLKRLIAQMGRPAAYRKDGGGDVHQAVACLGERGLASPCSDDISHAVAGRRKRSYQEHPACAPFLAACGRVSGQRTHTILACVAPPHVRSKARFMPVHRLCTWADRLLTLSPAGGAKSGSTLGKWRACLDQFPACKALITRLRGDASGLLACQKMLKTTGLSHDTLAQCQPLIDTMPSSALRLAFHASLECERETATTLGLDHIGLAISSESIASLCGVAKQHGVGETQDAARIALRLPALCGLPTREEAPQGLDVSVARQQAFTAQVISLTTQRREVLGRPARLESLSLTQGTPHVELIASPKHRSNCQNIVKISNSYEQRSGPQARRPAECRRLAKAATPGRRETAVTS
jgi:hypothetical protein